MKPPDAAVANRVRRLILGGRQGRGIAIFPGMDTMPPVDEMVRAYQESDPSYNGLFFLGVRTTGIFCRPICPARKPLVRNVEFFATARAALTSGYRPCKRCKPMKLDQQPEWAARLLAELEGNPSARILERDLRARGIDPATARRHFQKHYGMTFQAYARSRRLARGLHAIREGRSLDASMMETGYESSSGFRDAFRRAFGATPGQAKERGCVLLAWMPSPLGPLIAGASEEGVCLLEFTDRRMIETQLEAVARLFGRNVAPGRNGHLDLLESELAEYFEGARRKFEVPLVYPGTPFQVRVWEQLLRIPYGEVRSYEDIASGVGDAKAVRAVGHANGVNRIAIVIPCHRVVRKSGELGGYGGGLHRKKLLLELERGGASEGLF